MPELWLFSFFTNVEYSCLAAFRWSKKMLKMFKIKRLPDSYVTLGFGLKIRKLKVFDQDDLLSGSRGLNLLKRV